MSRRHLRIHHSLDFSGTGSWGSEGFEVLGQQNNLFVLLTLQLKLERLHPEAPLASLAATWAGPVHVCHAPAQFQTNAFSAARIYLNVLDTMNCPCWTIHGAVDLFSLNEHLNGWRTHTTHTTKARPTKKTSRKRRGRERHTKKKKYYFNHHFVEKLCLPSLSKRKRMQILWWRTFAFIVLFVMNCRRRCQSWHGKHVYIPYIDYYYYEDNESNKKKNNKLRNNYQTKETRALDILIHIVLCEIRLLWKTLD